MPTGGVRMNLRQYVTWLTPPGATSEALHTTGLLKRRRMRMRKLYVVSSVAAVLVAVMSLKSAGTEVRIGAWEPAGTLAQARAGASAVHLPDGRALITGGAGIDGALATAELLGPDGAFSRVAP